MKRAGVAGVVLASLAGATAGAQPLTPDKIAEKAIPSVVLIQTPAGLGTGFVVAPDGRIATNVHVIGGAQTASVTLSDGRKFDRVEVMGVDDNHDLMVIRIPVKGLQPLPLGDSARVKPGERIVAIGHPLGLGNTVSDGIVSAVRQVSDTLTVLQITAPISPGSSGGPIFNDRGEVIGISTLIVREGQNLNFGMPVNQIKPMLKNDKGVSLAAYKPIGGGGAPRRQIPTHDPSILAGCNDDQIDGIARVIQDAIKIGAPIYNQGNHEACYRIYAAAALDVDRKYPSCGGPRKALIDGVHRADGIKDYTGKAWAMRDAFDGLLDVIDRHFSASGPPAPSAGGVSLPPVPPRNVPNHPLTLLDGCSLDNVKRIAGSIADAIDVGAPLYNAGNVEACYRVYEGTILDITRKLPGCAGPKKALNAGLKEASTRSSWGDKAWALRDAFDGMLDLIDRKLRGTN